MLTGDVAILFTDIEGSTTLWEQDGARMSRALAAHDALARSAVEGHHGKVVKMIGDGMHAVFADARDALDATLDLQKALANPAATCGVPLRVRCGMHAGLVERRDNDFFGSPVNRAARIMSAAHGGQVLLSQAVVDTVGPGLPIDVSLRDLGNVRLKDLATPEHVYQLVHPQLRLDFPALRSLEATPNNLPQQGSRFIGRDHVLDDLKRLLAKTRLLTLTGAGGCGKTRLSLQLAADSLEQFPDGVWLVELAPLSDSALIPQTIATVLGLKEEVGAPLAQTLAAHLRDRRLLLILDNCEHVIDVSAKLALSLVRQCEQLKILASSREALGISGEQIYRVPSLALPDPAQTRMPEAVAQCEAGQLFIDRAVLARADFRITSGNASALASICLRLDGIPLALELAAARVGSLSVEEINNKLDQRFRLLTGGSRAALPRQQTLRSLIDWSYDLLRPTEQAMLRRLSVFVGGWSLSAVETVCSGEGVASEDVLNLLSALVDKSLVLMEEHSGTTRYRLLEMVRQYARDRLLEHGDGAAWRDRHLTCFVTLGEEAAPQLRGALQQNWLDRLEIEHDNLRAALLWASAPQGDTIAGLRLADALFKFWYVRGYFREASGWLSALLEAGPGAPAAARAHALGGAGVMAWQQGDYPTARRDHEAALTILREQGDRHGIAGSLINLGLVDFDQGNYAAARARFQEGLAIRREIGSPQSVASALHNLAAVANASGDPERAWALFDEGLAIYREADDPWGMAMSLSNLGSVAETLDEPRHAGTLYEESLSLRRELGDRRGIAESLEGLACIAADLASPERAARLWGATERLREEIGAPFSPLERASHDRKVAAARAAMAEGAAFDRALQQGRSMTQDQAIDFALTNSV